MIQSQDVGSIKDNFDMWQRRGGAWSSEVHEDLLKGVSFPGETRSFGVSAVRKANLTAPLRCKRCHGSRSSSYHHRHAQDPVANPPVGICSRHWTGCAAAKLTIQLDVDRPGTSGIHELPANELVPNSDIGSRKQ